jgi:hypothetical protein
MATNNPGTKTRSFQQVVPFFGAANPVIHILEGGAPQLRLKPRMARRAANEQRFFVCDRALMCTIRPTRSQGQDDDIGRARSADARKKPRSGERGAVLAAS